MIPAGVVAGQLLSVDVGIGVELVEDGEFASGAGWQASKASFTQPGVTIDGPGVGGAKSGSISRPLARPLVATAYRLTVDRVGALTVIFRDGSGSQQQPVPDGSGPYVVGFTASGSWTSVALVNDVADTTVTVAEISLQRVG